jgi:hypothetical protein
MKHALCKICLVSFPRKNGYSKKYCSEVCFEKSLKFQIKCKPICAESTIIAVPTVFKDGTHHFKKVCSICNKHHNFGPRINHIDIKKKEATVNAELKVRKEKYKDSFYTSKAWLSVRYDLIISSKKECSLCGSKEKPFHVDHIKPRSKNPELELNISNLQILCAACNIGKSNKQTLNSLWQNN